MAMAEPLVLVANPGSVSRKYALYERGTLRASLHFEYDNQQIICTYSQGENQHVQKPALDDIAQSSNHVLQILREHNAMKSTDQISLIGLRIVAPGSFFLRDHIINDDVVARLQTLYEHAPLHIGATLDELRQLQQRFPGSVLVGISDSVFHITKPDHAWNYGISIEDADRLEIKRYGYHGISIASIVESLRQAKKLPPKVIAIHLGGGASVTAIQDGKSIDTTMGYSPLEGVIMSTRSGSIDITAGRVLKDALGFDDRQLDDYLNKSSGLLGLGGSNDLRELLRREADGDHKAELALLTYVYSIQKAVGEMAAALGGVDLLAFTGTIGERSAPIRQRVSAQLHYLDFFLDKASDQACVAPTTPTIVSRLAQSKPIFVIPSDESAQIAKRAIQASY